MKSKISISKTIAIKTAVPLFVAGLLFLLVACQPRPAIQEAAATTVTGTALQTANPKTPTGIATLITGTPNPAWQSIRDTQSRFSLSIPADWYANDDGTYSGEDGFVEMGYLPDMGDMTRALQVCQWLANVETHDIYDLAWVNMTTSCELTPQEAYTDYPYIGVIENPDAPPAYHYAYIKTDPDHGPLIMGSFNWLPQTSQAQSGDNPPAGTDFWTKAVLPQGISVTEYELSSDGQDNKEVLYPLIPADMIPTRQTKTTAQTDEEPTWESFNQQVAQYGYEFRATGVQNWYQLYQNGEMKIDNVYVLPALNRIPTANGEKIIFLVRSLKDPNLSPFDPENLTIYLVDEQSISVWQTGPDNPMQPGEYAIVVNGEMLWARLGEGTRMEVINARRDVLYTFETYFGTRIPMEGFWAWQNHWVMEISDFVIMDGVVLNQEYGYESMFEWHAINDSPFYFFQDGSNYGVSFDGQVLPVHYEAIKHGLCCGYAVDNPRITQDSARFFALKDGKWVYVLIDFNS